MFRRGEADLEAYAKRFDWYYNSGRIDLPFDKIPAELIAESPHLARVAFEAGVRDAKETTLSDFTSTNTMEYNGQITEANGLPEELLNYQEPQAAPHDTERSKSRLEGASKLIDSKLVEKLAQSGQKFTREALVGIAKTPAGKIVWLEKGNASAGLEHIMQRHAKEFASAGFNSSDEIAEFVIKAVKSSDGVKDGGATIFDVVMGGKQRQLKVVISDNGFIVTAHPFSK